MVISILVDDDEANVAELFRQRSAVRRGKGSTCYTLRNRVIRPFNFLDDEIEPEPLAVLSDINMPGMDGLQLLGEIKQRFPDLPVMMVTAYGDDERRRRASELGAAEFITKPVDFDYLKEQLRQLPSVAD